jgi:hypothetical protein
LLTQAVAVVAQHKAVRLITLRQEQVRLALGLAAVAVEQVSLLP